MVLISVCFRKASQGFCPWKAILNESSVSLYKPYTVADEAIRKRNSQ
jgi:hypothetical protein